MALAAAQFDAGVGAQQPAVGWTIRAGQEWQPTFVAFVSLPAATVLMYGRGWKIAVVGAVLGALLVTPSSLLLVNFVFAPLALPG